MSSSSIDSDLRAEIASVAESVDCELLHVAFEGGQLRVILDRPDEAVTLDHCSSVSRQLSALLDVHDFGRGRYVLEVSSPGLDRELYGAADYQRFVGRLARITFQDGDARRTVVGRLAAYRPDGDAGPAIVEIREEPADRAAGRVSAVPLRDIHQARLEVEL